MFIKSYYRCPKFDSYAMQTLDIRVEQKRNRFYFSKSRQNETSVSKTEENL